MASLLFEVWFEKQLFLRKFLSKFSASVTFIFLRDIYTIILF